MNFAKKVMRLSYGMEFTHGMRRKVMGSLALVYFLYLGFDVVAVTTLFAISMLTMTFFEFPTGAVADYDSRRKSVLIGFFLIALAFFGVFFFRNFWLLAGSWILGDVAWTFISGAQGAWSIDALKIGKDKKKLVDLTAKEYTFEKSGHIIGGLLALIIVAINFSFIWLFLSLTNFAMFIILFFHMEERNFHPEKVPHNYLKKSLIKAKESINYIIHKKNKELRVLIIAAFLSFITFGIFSVAIPLLFVQSLGLEEQYLPGIYAGLTIFALGIPTIIAKASHKKGFRKPLFFSMLTVALTIMALAFSQSVIYAIVMLGIFTFGEIGLAVVADSAYQHEFDSKIRASLDSFTNINWSVANSFAVFVAGILVTTIGLMYTMIIAGIIGVISSLIYLGGLKK